MKKIDTRKIARTALLLAASLIISLIENMLPPLVPVLPYAKLGLSNVVLLACFLTVGFKEGFLVLTLRCLLNAVFSGNYSALLWSVPSSLASYILMAFMIRLKIFSVAATSATGGMTHNLTQILVAAAIIGDSVFLYLPYMLVIGFFAGLFTGVCCHFCLATADRLNKKKMRHFGGDVGTDYVIIEKTEDKSDGDTSDNAESGDNRLEDKYLNDNTYTANGKTNEKGKQS